MRVRRMIGFAHMYLALAQLYCVWVCITVWNALHGRKTDWSLK